MKRKKIISYFLIFLICFTACVSSLQISNAAVSYSKITDSTNIDSKYSFSPRFISGVTKAEGFGGKNGSSSSDNWKATWNSSKKQYIYETQPDYWYYIRLTDNSQKGKVGMWYRNVGQYKGKVVDLKITIADWEAIKNPITINTNKGKKKSYPTIAFNTDTIKINPAGGYVKAPTYRFSYYDQNGNPLAISGHTNFIDIDDEQYMESSHFTKGYLTSNTKLTIKGNGVREMNGYESNNSDKTTWCTALFDNRSYYDVKFSSWRQDSEGYPTDKSRKNRGFFTMLVNGNSLAPFTTPTPIKSATSVVHKSEDLIYNIDFTVPQQPSEYLYSKFVLSDTLPKGVKYKSYSVTNDAGSNVTSDFAASLNGQNLTLTVKSPSASNFYYKSYKLTINCVADNNYDFSSYNGKVIANNVVTITSKAGSRAEQSSNSNTVSTEIKFRINTSTDGNGTITSSMNNISGGENKTITYTPKAGYEVSTITVDGKNITVDSSNKKAYTFSNIYDHHNIHVTFKPTTDNKITVTKKVHKNDLKSAYGNPVGIFKCEGKDLNGSTHEYYEVAELTKDDLSGDYYTKSVSFNNLTAGTYKVTEVDTSRYDLTSVAAGSGATSSNNILSCDLVNNKEAKGTFINSLSKFNLWSHSDLIINSFR